MRRRDFMAGLVSAAVLQAVAAGAQPPGKVYRLAGVEPSPTGYFLDDVGDATRTGGRSSASCAGRAWTRSHTCELVLGRVGWGLHNTSA